MSLFIAGDVICMDNASYHTRTQVDLPNSKSGKPDYVEYMTANNIPFESQSQKNVLWKEVQKHIKENHKYVAEKLAEKYKIIICRTPPYHCELNPIEKVWGFGKAKLRKTNIWNQNSLLEKCIDIFNSIEATFWAKCVDHAKKQEIIYAKFDKLDLYEEDIAPEDIQFEEENIVLEDDSKKTLKCDSDGCDFEAKTIYLFEKHRLGKHS